MPNNQGVTPSGPGSRASHGADKSSPPKASIPNALGYVPVVGWRAVRRYRCEECHEQFTEDEILSATNPFDPIYQIYGCPHCKEVEAFALLCDFQECPRFSSSGEPTPEGGYVHRCHEHSLWAFARRDSDTRPKDGDAGSL